MSTNQDNLVPVELVTTTYSIDEDGVTETSRETTATAYITRAQLDAAGFGYGDDAT
jgi:hypothetical protein